MKNLQDEKESERDEKLFVRVFFKEKEKEGKKHQIRTVYVLQMESFEKGRERFSALFNGTR